MRNFFLTVVFCFNAITQADNIKTNWKYSMQKASPNWETTDFDDSSWQKGMPGFGGGNLAPPQKIKIRTAWESSKIFVRGTFNVTKSPSWSILKYSHHGDLTVYLNGRRIFTESGITFDWKTTKLAADNRALFKKGLNVIAACCQPAQGGQFLDLQITFFANNSFTSLAIQKDIPRPEYPRPDFHRNEWLNLNGEWEFEIDREGTGLSRKLFLGKTLKEKIRVPYPPESKLSGIEETDFLKHVWYHRTVRIPKNITNKKILLHFGAVDYFTTVWINGLKTGTHRGGYTPFSFDITSKLVDGIADIVVLADDPMDSGIQPTGKQSRRLESHGCVYTRTSGIWQTVWIEPVPRTYLFNVRLIPDLNHRLLLISPQVINPTPGMKLVARAKIGDEIVGEVFSDLSWGLTPLVLRIRKLHLWSMKDPFLYDLDLILKDKTGNKIDSVSCYFGMRSISIAGDKVLLNGKSLFQRLVLIQGYYPDGIYTAPSDEDFKHDIELSQDMGFNGARLHMKVFDPRFIYWADKLGFLVWDESPNWGMDHSNPAAVSLYLKDWITTMQRDFNHPAIIGWCPFNETPANQWREGIAMVYRVTKALDPTRPVIDTSGFVHVVSDIYDSHNYVQNPKRFKELFEGLATNQSPWHNNPYDAVYQGQPYMVSEFGGTSWLNSNSNGWGYGNAPKSRTEFILRFRGLSEALLFNEAVSGFCYTQLYDIEQERNGLYTYDRKPKFTSSQIRRIIKQKAAIEE